jgi:hypothetical protein
METVKVTLGISFVVIVLVSVFVYIFSLSSKCEEKNGILVRTPFGFTCMEKVR